MIVSRNGVVSPTIELSTGVRRIHLFRISLWRVVVMLLHVHLTLLGARRLTDSYYLHQSLYNQNSSVPGLT